MEQFQKYLQDSCIAINASQRQISSILVDNDWYKHSIWLNLATRLDESRVYYLTPAMYKTLCILTSLTPPYIEGQASGGRITIYIVGVYEEEQPFGPFWDDKLTEKLEKLRKGDGDVDLSGVVRVLKFADVMQRDISRGDARRRLWELSYQDAYRYSMLHRRIVRRVGRVLEEDMEDHDLTKTRIVQLALGFSWHWPGEREDTDNEKALKELGLDAVKAGHLEMEDHHPEFGATEHGSVVSGRLFSDRLAVHLQKDTRDTKGGWDIRPVFIPPNLKGEFEEFKTKYSHKDLYKKVYDPALPGDLAVGLERQFVTSLMWNYID